MQRPALPRSQAVLGLTIFASIALPLAPSGTTMLDLVIQALRDNLAGGLVFMCMFASPQLFGLAVAASGSMRDEGLALAFVQPPVVIMQGMVLLAGLSLAGAPRAIAPLGLLGFAAVTSIYFMYASAEAAASDRGGLSLRWYVRWGALLVAGTGLWFRLQSLGNLHLGVAIDVAVAAAALLLVALRRADPAPAPVAVA